MAVVIEQRFNDTTKDLAFAIITQLGGTMADVEQKYNSTTDDLLYTIAKLIEANGGTGGTGTAPAPTLSDSETFDI